MNKATRTAASTLGVYAGLLAIEHGAFEILQGSVRPAALLINAIGPPCQMETAWHACFPALTLIPNFLVSGIVAVIIGLILVTWAAVFIQRKRGGLILIVLSMLALLVGGGFVPVFISIIAGVAATRIHAPLGQKRRPLLAALWPWPLVVLAVWAPGAWLLGHFFNQFMLDVGFVFFLCFDFGLPLLIVFSARAHDILVAMRDDN
ncbi:MAG: hypothetical protein JXB38_15830 [Anaerolineales bacterium]|nr:hypothetical protein [Anaerolineales bacterium]